MNAPDPACPAPDGRHGTSWRYSRWGCRCPDAVAAYRAERRRRDAAYRARLRTGSWQRSSRARHNMTGGRHGIDPVAVERAAGGDRSLVLTAEERAAAVALLASWRMTTAQIADRLGCTDRTVFRHLARLRATTSPSTTQEVSA